MELTKEFLYQRYVTERKSTNQIAKECRYAGNSTVCRRLKQFNIPIRTRSASMKGKVPSISTREGRIKFELVKNPKLRLVRNKSWLYGKYVRDKLPAREIAGLCNCGKGAIIRWLHKFKIETRKGTPSWKGGRFLKNDGYAVLRISGLLKVICYYPNKSKFTKKDLSLAKQMCTTLYILEHRLFMAMQLKRPLESWEEVHHKNGIRDDNSLENLELRMTKHGAGQLLENLQEQIKKLKGRKICVCCGGVEDE